MKITDVWENRGKFLDSYKASYGCNMTCYNFLTSGNLTASQFMRAIYAGYPHFLGCGVLKKFDS